MKKDMGGLKKYMPKTFWTFIIGTLALVGHLPARGLLVEGRDPRRRRAPQLHRVLRRRAGRRVHDRRLHDALHLPHVLRRVSRRPRRRERRSRARGSTCTTAEEHAPRAAREQQLDPVPAVHPHGLGDRRRVLELPALLQVREVVPAGSPNAIKDILHAVPFNPILALGSVLIAATGIGAARGPSTPDRLHGAGTTCAAQQGWRTRARRSSSTSTSSTGCTPTSSSAGSRVRSRRRVLVQPERHRQRSELHRARARRRGHGSRTTSSTRRVSTASSTASPRSPARPAASRARSKPDDCSSTRCCSSRRSCCSRSSLDLHLGKGNWLDALLVRHLGVDARGLHPRGGRGDPDAPAARERRARSSGRRC